MSLFDLSVRTTLCTECGAVLQAGALDDRAPCASCATATALPPRVLQPHPPRPMPQDPALRAAAVETLAVPPDQQRLWESERSIPAHREREAFDVHADLRRKVLAGDTHRTRALVVMARELMLRALARGEPGFARALGESTLDAVSDPLARACMHGALVRAALRVGDLDAAEAWLRAFDPTPASLLADTELRLCAAAVAFARGDAAATLAFVGTSEDEVVTHVMLGWLAALLRAAALETTGRADDARRELVALLARRPTALEAIDHNLPRLSYLGEIPAWYAVRREFLERTRPVGDLESEGRVVLAIAVLLLAGMCTFAFYKDATRDFLLFAVALVVTVPLVYTGTRLIARGRRLHRAFVRGRPVDATVRDVVRGLYGRGRHNRLSVVHLQLRATPDAAPTEAFDQRFLDPRDLLRWKAGAKVTAFVDAADAGVAVVTTPPP